MNTEAKDPSQDSKFSEAERLVEEAAREGREVVFSDSERRCLPGEFVRKVYLSGEIPRGGRFQIVGAAITGTLDLRYCTVDTPIQLLDCDLERIDAKGLRAPYLKLDGCRIQPRDKEAKGINLYTAAITGGVSMTEYEGKRFSCSAQIDMHAAHIGGHLILRGAAVTHEGFGAEDAAVFLDGTIVDQGVFLDDGFTCWGQVRMIGAKIGGVASLEDATLTLTGAPALIMDLSRITGSVFLRKKRKDFTCHGQVKLVNARIGSQLNLRGAILTHAGGGNQAALILNRAVIAGNVLLDKEFTCSGQIRMIGGSIGDRLDLSDSTLSYTEGVALNISDVHVTGMLVLGSRPTALDLSFTTVDRLGTTSKTFNPEVFKTGSNVNGLRYDLLSVDDKSVREGWVAKLGELEAERSAYLHLAKVFRDHGLESWAQKTMIAMHRHRRDRHWTQRQWWRWLGSFFVVTPVSHLWNRPIKALLALGILILALGTFMTFESPRAALRATDEDNNIYTASSEAMATTQADAGTQRLRTCAASLGEVQCFQPWLYAADVAIPLVNLGQSSTWRPFSSTRLGSFVQWVEAVSSGLGWVFATAGGLGAGALGVARHLE